MSESCTGTHKWSILPTPASSPQAPVVTLWATTTAPQRRPPHSADHCGLVCALYAWKPVPVLWSFGVNMYVRLSLLSLHVPLSCTELRMCHVCSSVSVNTWAVPSWGCHRVQVLWS